MRRELDKVNEALRKENGAQVDALQPSTPRRQWFLKVRHLRLSIEVRSVVQAGHAVVICGGCLTFSCCSDALNVALPAECLVLALKPRESLIKMLWLVIWPIFVPDIKIRVNGLHREKTAQAPTPTPAHNQIQT